MDGTVERDHNYPLATCPHCNRTVPGNMIDLHASVCVHRPEMHARILAALTTDVPGVGARLKDYDVARVAVGAPYATSLLRAYGGTWTAVLDAFGLTPWVSPNRRTPKTAAQQRMTLAQKEQLAIQDVDAMSADARRTLAAEYDNAHTLHAYAEREVPELRINGKPAVALMLR